MHLGNMLRRSVELGLVVGLTTLALARPACAVPQSRLDDNGVRATAVPLESFVSGAALPLRTDPPPADWRALGPFGGDVEAVAVSPTNANIMLAGLAPASGTGKLYRSTNAGVSWSEVVALAGKNVYDIAFAPAGTAYIGTTDGVWKSTNNGANWTQLGLGIGANDVVMALTIDPSNANTIWAGVSDAMGQQAQTVLRSTNGGTNWTNQTPPMAPMACRGIAVHPSNSNRIYACFGGDFGGGAVWVSSNGGTNWFNRSGGLPANPMNDMIHDGSRVYLCGGLLFGSQTVGLYSSTNEGVTWTAIHDASWPSLIIRDMDLDPNAPGTICLGSDGRGVFRSTNGGTTWSFGIGGTESFAVRAIRFAPGSSTRLVIGLGSLGVYQSQDAGATFVPASIGIGALDIYSIAANPFAPDEIAVAFQGQNDGGIYTSYDGGASWILEPCPATRYGTVRYTDAGVLHAISTGPTNVAQEGVYRRAPDSGVWTCLGPDQGGLYESDLRGLRFSHHDPDLILASGADFGVAGWEGTCWITTDGGATWTKSYEGPEQNEMVFDLAIIEDGTDQTVVACFTDYGQSTGGALRSTDGGASWVSAGVGLPLSARGAALDAFSGDPATLYYADAEFGNGHGGLYKTTDAGLTWSSAGYAGQGSVGSVVCDPSRPGVLYITRPDPEKVMVSVNGGATFNAYNTGLNVVGSVRFLALGTNPPRLLLATTTGSAASSLADPAGIGGGPEAEAHARFLVGPNPAIPGGVVSFDLSRVGPRRDAFDEGLGILVVDPVGRCVRRMAVNDAWAAWDLRDDSGRAVPAGLYLALARRGDRVVGSEKIHVAR